jgi:hypothetical protein
MFSRDSLEVDLPKKHFMQQQASLRTTIERGVLLVARPEPLKRSTTVMFGERGS